MTGTIFAIVLAAGLSRRFGEGDKLMAPLQGQPLAAHIADTIASMDLAGRIAVCRAENGALAELFRQRGFSVVANRDSMAGQSSSLRLGVAAAQKGGADAVMVCLADMPFVRPRHLSDLIGLGHTDLAASMSEDGGPPMPPAVFARHHFAALAALTGDGGARTLLRQAPTLRCPARDLRDFDRAADFDAIRDGPQL